MIIEVRNMTMGYTPGLIGTAQAPNPFGSQKDIARAPGVVMPYSFKATKPKKQLKEIRKVLLPEKKKFLFIRYGYKFNMKHRCVVCGTQQHWEASDPARPHIPLTEVTKGRPLRGTYCLKHTGMWRQMEMLEQQMLADEHGLEFTAFIPKPRVPQMLQKGPLRMLRPQDIESLTALGWTIAPPGKEKEEPPEEYARLMQDVSAKLKRIDALVAGQEGEK